MNVLFVSWNGPGTPSRESLLLPIFARLAGTGINVETFQLAACSADTIVLPQAIPALVRHAQEHAIDVFMPRGVVAAAVVLQRDRVTHWRCTGITVTWPARSWNDTSAITP